MERGVNDVVEFDQDFCIIQRSVRAKNTVINNSKSERLQRKERLHTVDGTTKRKFEA